MNCPDCQSQQVVKNGKTRRQDSSIVQKYLCKSCGKKFNERRGTSEGLGIRANGRCFGKSHSTIMRWEQRLAQQTAQWSPGVPEGADVTVEGDELYTRLDANLPRQGAPRMDNPLH